MSGAYTHRPVLLEEAIQGLAIRPDGAVSYTHLTLPTTERV